MNQNGGEEREMTAGGRGGLRMTAWGIENVEGFENDCVSKVSTQICTLYQIRKCKYGCGFFFAHRECVGWAKKSFHLA